MQEFKLPSLGSDMEEGTLLQWNVVPGQAVKKGDVIAVVDTSKAAIDIECWHDGRVLRLLAEVGQKIPVGTVMALLLAPGEQAPAQLAQQSAAAPAPTLTMTAASRLEPAPLMSLSVSAPVAYSAARSQTTRQRVSPAGRQRAAALGVALDAIKGTGLDGAVTLADVDAAASAPKGAPPPSTKLEAITPAERAAEMRKSIATAMARSKREIPHYYLSEAVPMQRALDWLREANLQRPVTARLLPAVLLLKAVALAVRETPEINGMFVDGSFRPSERVHLGVAISLRQGGLVAPALHDVDQHSLDELMQGLADLVKRCRAGSLRSSEMSDPTLTVTNLGDGGVESVFGVIYPPQVALVGLGSVADRAWVEDGRLVVMPVLTASLSADHRVSDGHRGALFLARLRELLQHPEHL